LCAIEDAVAQRTEPLPFGTAVFHPGVPWVREVNVVRVETTSRSVTAAELAHAARERFPSLPAVEILHEPLGADVAPRFAAAGWRVSRHLLMALLEPPPAPDLPVQEVPVDEVSSMLAWERGRAELTGARAFCVRDGGRPVSMCLLVATDHADEVERVYTTPSHRGRGLARAVVARAAREAGDQLTFLFTDAHGAAQHLYARLGFRRQWVVYRFSTENELDTRRTV
jgi:GNAT superfamily N-acetyltransferase